MLLLLGYMLHTKHTATHCSTLHHTATHCKTLQHTIANRELQVIDVGFRIAQKTHSNTLQHTATHCNTLHCTATHCNTLQHTINHRELQITAAGFRVAKKKNPNLQVRCHDLVQLHMHIFSQISIYSLEFHYILLKFNIFS